MSRLAGRRAFGAGAGVFEHLPYDGVEFRIGRLNARDRGVDEFKRRRLLRTHKLRLADAVVTRKGVMRGRAYRVQASTDERRSGGRAHELTAIAESLHASTSASYLFPPERFAWRHRVSTVRLLLPVHSGSACASFRGALTARAFALQTCTRSSDLDSRKVVIWNPSSRPPGAPLRVARTLSQKSSIFALNPRDAQF